MLTKRAKRLQTLFVLILGLSVRVTKSKTRVVRNMDSSDFENYLADSLRQTTGKDVTTEIETSRSVDSNNRKTSHSGLGERKSLDKRLKTLNILQGSSGKGDSDDMRLMLLKDLEEAPKTHDSRKTALNLIETNARESNVYSGFTGEPFKQKPFRSQVDEHTETDQENADQQYKDLDQLQKYNSKNRFNLGTQVAQSRRKVFRHGGDTAAKSAKTAAEFSNGKRIASIEALDELEKKEITDSSKSLNEQANHFRAGFKRGKDEKETVQDENGASEGLEFLSLHDEKVQNDIVHKTRRQRIGKFHSQQVLHSKSPANDQNSIDGGAQDDDEVHLTFSRLDEAMLQETKEADKSDKDSGKPEELGTPKLGPLRNVETNRAEEKLTDNHESSDSDKFLELLKGINGKPYWESGESGQLSDLDMMMSTGKTAREEVEIKTKQTRVGNDEKSPVPHKAKHGERKHHSMRKTMETERCTNKHAQCPLLMILGRLGRSCNCEEEAWRRCSRRQNNAVVVHSFNRLAARCFTFQELEECDGLGCRIVHVVSMKKTSTVLRETQGEGVETATVDLFLESWQLKG